MDLSHTVIVLSGVKTTKIYMSSNCDQQAYYHKRIIIGGVQKG